MRRTFVGLGGLTLSALMLASLTAKSSGAPPGAARGAGSGGTAGAVVGTDDGPTTSGTGVSPASPIKHVVIIYQENHTFDDVLGTVCQAAERAMPCDGYVGPVTFQDGITAENVVQPDNIPIVDHNPYSQAWGMHNKWDLIAGCRDAPYFCVSHVDPANMQNLTRFANEYVIADRTFAAGQASSFGAHVTLGGGTFDGFQGYNPVLSKKGVKPREGWGCSSRRDALWGYQKPFHYWPSCIPDQKGKGPYRATKVPYTPTIMERMERAHLSWHMYEGEDQGTKPDLTTWSVCTYYSWCWRHRWNLAFDSPRQHFVEDATAGTLPNLSILLPTGNVSQHNGTSMVKGDNYLGEMVSAVMNGPDWDSTAIFITYDDCGCFYDHVDPPRRRMGLRNPMVIISPWAKPGYTDSHPAIQPYSALAFTVHVFGLQPLSAEVSHSYDYHDSFDFSQQPLSGIPVTHRSISAAERRKLAEQLPMVEDDPA